LLRASTADHVTVSNRQIEGRAEAWLYLGTVVHMLLLLGTVITPMVWWAITQGSGGAVHWSDSKRNGPYQHWARIIVPLLAWDSPAQRCSVSSSPPAHRGDACVRSVLSSRPSESHSGSFRQTRPAEVMLECSSYAAKLGKKAPTFVHSPIQIQW
jgi:hypothetical protein